VDNTSFLANLEAFLDSSK